MSGSILGNKRVKTQNTFGTELGELLIEDSSQSQDELVPYWGMTKQAISKDLKDMRVIRSKQIWVPYELKAGNDIALLVWTRNVRTTTTSSSATHLNVVAVVSH